MTVNYNGTLVADHEGSYSYATIGAGQGATQNANFPLIGGNCSGRKADNVSFPQGFWFNTGSAFDLSGEGEHVLFWAVSLTPILLTDIGFRVGSVTTAYEQFQLGVTSYPDLGGYQPFWVAIDSGTDTGTPDFSVADEFAQVVGMGDISQNLQNNCTDQTRHGTRPQITLDGTSVGTADIVTADVTNRYGVLVARDGVFYCFANFQAGSLTATTVSGDTTTIVFPDASWLPATSGWLGIDIDLQNGITDIDWEGRTIQSGDPTGATARKPSLLVTDNSGVFGLAGAILNGFRRIGFTDGVTCTGATIQNSGQIDPTNGDYSGEMSLSGTDEYVDTQESVDLDQTAGSGDFEIIMRVQPADWTPGSVQTLAAHYGGTAATASYRFRLTTGGAMELIVSNGSAETTLTSSTLAASDGFRDGHPKWVRVTYDQSAGQADFFTSSSPSDTPSADVIWTAQGTPSGTSRIIPSNSRPLTLGAENDGTAANFFIGEIFFFELWTDGFKATGVSLGDLISRADWRTGLDFVLSTRVDDHDLTGLTWEELGASPTYTQGGAETTAADFDGTTISNSTSESALLWNVNTDPNGELDNVTLNSGGSGHGFEFGPLTPSSITLTGVSVNGYAVSDGSTGDETIFNNTGKALTINLIGTSGTFSVRDGTGSTTTLVVSPVTATFRCFEGSTDTDIQNVRVLVYAGPATGGMKADAAITSITESSDTATVTTTAAHGLATDDIVLIKDTVESGSLNAEAVYTGTHVITVTGASEFTYDVSGSPTTPATRTYDFSEVIVDNGLTNVDGEVSDTRSYSSAQAIIGVASKGSVSPVFKAQPISGTISNSANTTIPVPMVAD